MAGHEDIRCAQSVVRKIPGHVRVIQWMLYTAVLIFTVIGAMQGFLWLFPALGTLFGSWYYMGVARVTYEYTLEGTRFTVERVSGLKSKRKAVLFGEFDLTKLIIMAPEGSPALEQAEADSMNAGAMLAWKAIGVETGLDPDDICSVMYLTAIGKDAGRPLKVFFQPSPEMRESIRRAAPGRVTGYGE